MGKYPVGNVLVGNLVTVPVGKSSVGKGPVGNGEQRSSGQRSSGQKSSEQRSSGQRSGGQKSNGQRSSGQRSSGQRCIVMCSWSMSDLFEDSFDSFWLRNSTLDVYIVSRHLACQYILHVMAIRVSITILKRETTSILKLCALQTNLLYFI